MGSVAQFHPEVPQDPREQAVRDPYAPPYITIPAMKPLDGAYQASVHRSKRAQKLERLQLLEDASVAHSEEFTRTQLLDTLATERLAKSADWPTDISQADRVRGSAIGIRLGEPIWQAIGRYRMADAILVELRKSQAQHGWYLADSDLRPLCDQLAKVSMFTLLKVWSGQAATTALQWSKAKLGFLAVSEEW